MMPSLTRREFLKGAALQGALLAGAGIVSARADRPDGSPPDYDCIIVGAGTAGLAAALRLRQAGWTRLLVVEKQPGAGGICWTKTEHGFRFPMGTTYIAKPWKGSAVKAIYESLPEKWYRPFPEPEDSLFHDGKILVDATVFHDWEKIPGITAAQTADCAALAAWFQKAYKKCEWPLWSNRGGPLAEWEAKTIRELIHSIRPQCDPWVMGCLDSFTRGVFNGNVDEIGALQGIDMIGDECDNKGENITGASTFVVADLVDTLVREIGAEHFSFETEATAVERVGSRVNVTLASQGRQSVQSCSYCVVAAGAVAARALVADLPPNARKALESIRYGRYAVVNLVMKDHTVPIHAFDCTLGDNIIDDIYDFTFVQKEAQGIPLDQPPGIYGCYIAARNPDDLTPLQPRDDLVKMCLAQIDLIFGKGTSDGVTSTHVAQYERGMPVFYPGLTWEQESNLMPMIQERILLANDYVQGSPTIEGAMEAGWHAGGKIAEAKG